MISFAKLGLIGDLVGYGGIGPLAKDMLYPSFPIPLTSFRHQSKHDEGLSSIFSPVSAIIIGETAWSSPVVPVDSARPNTSTGALGASLLQLATALLSGALEGGAYQTSSPRAPPLRGGSTAKLQSSYYLTTCELSYPLC